MYSACTVHTWRLYEYLPFLRLYHEHYKHCQSNFIFYNRLCRCNLSSPFYFASHNSVRLSSVQLNSTSSLCRFILRVSHNYLCMHCNIRLNRTKILGTISSVRHCAEFNRVPCAYACLSKCMRESFRLASYRNVFII